jgi:hypothetical protein
MTTPFPLRLLSTASILTAFLIPTATLAQAASPACATVDASLPVPWTGWTLPEQIQGAATPGTVTKLLVGRAYSAALRASPTVTYAVPLNKPAAPATFGGLFTFSISSSGTYSIALSDAAWIDVASADGKVFSSVAHGHGPACTSIHKVVDFTFAPGTYILQLSAAPTSPTVIDIAQKS